jgi:hypothetical protein
MRFDPQTIVVTDNKDRYYPIDALVALHDDGTPIGLAVHPAYELGPGPMTPNFNEYTLTHLPSGVRLHSDPVATEAIARRWLERMAPLTDWTQPREALHQQDTLRLQVRVARVHAQWDEAEELDLSLRQAGTCRHSPSLFTTEGLTILIEWMAYAMEFVVLPQEAVPTLDALLSLHAELARRRVGVFPQELPLTSTTLVVS